MFAWLTKINDERRRSVNRRYYARREAEGMRMQHGARAEAVCLERLEASGNARRRRFLTLVLKALAQT